MELSSANESQELERLRRILLMRNKAMLLGMIVGDLAHDLNNPLTVINGNVELLQLSQAAQDAKIKKRLDTIQSGAKRIAEKLRCVQLFTKSGHASEHFDLNQVAQDSTLIAEFLAKPAKVTIVTELASEPMVAMGNPNQIAQALLALVDNAIDAVKQSPSPRVVISTGRLPSNKVSIVVANQGSWIDTELGNRIFEPFFTTKENCAGLGLFIARQLAEENQGAIDWRSTPELTEFVISLPSSERSEP